MKVFLIVVILFFCGILNQVVLAVNHSAQASASPEAAIRSVDAEWREAVKAKDVDRILSFYTEDASYLPQNAAVAVGKEEIRKVWSAMLAIPDFSEKWEITKIDISESADLAVTQGAYTATYKNEEGKASTERGKFIQIWKKQKDDTWKVTTEIFNTDAPPTSNE